MLYRCLIPIAVPNQSQTELRDGKLVPVWGIKRVKNSPLPAASFSAEQESASLTQEIDYFANTHIYVTWKLPGEAAASTEMIIEDIVVMVSSNTSSIVERLNTAIPDVIAIPLFGKNPFIDFMQTLSIPQEHKKVFLVKEVYQYQISGIDPVNKIRFLWRLLSCFLDPQRCHGVLQMTKLKIEGVKRVLHDHVLLLMGRHSIHDPLELTGVAEFINQLARIVCIKNMSDMLPLLAVVAKNIQTDWQSQECPIIDNTRPSVTQYIWPDLFADLAQACQSFSEPVRSVSFAAAAAVAASAPTMVASPSKSTSSGLRAFANRVTRRLSGSAPASAVASPARSGSRSASAASSPLTARRSESTRQNGLDLTLNLLEQYQKEPKRHVVKRLALRCFAALILKSQGDVLKAFGEWHAMTIEGNACSQIAKTSQDQQFQQWYTDIQLKFPIPIDIAPYLQAYSITMPEPDYVTRFKELVVPKKPVNCLRCMRQQPTITPGKISGVICGCENSITVIIEQAKQSILGDLPSTPAGRSVSGTSHPYDSADAIYNPLGVNLSGSHLVQMQEQQQSSLAKTNEENPSSFY